MCFAVTKEIRSRLEIENLHLKSVCEPSDQENQAQTI